MSEPSRLSDEAIYRAIRNLSIATIVLAVGLVAVATTLVVGALR